MANHWITASCVGALALATPLVAQQPPRTVETSAFGPAGAACAELRYTDFGNIEEAMTQIIRAEPMKGVEGVPDYCEVEAYVWRQTRFRLRFPLHGWNEKLLVEGGGGQSGDLPVDDRGAGPGSAPLRQGYAQVNHNGGHFSSITDAKWSYFNEPAMIDFGFRSPHVATVAAKSILAHIFGNEPRRSYFNGCSNGGREAMMMAQRFPWDFDGIIAGAPSMDVRALILNLYHASSLLEDQTRSGFDIAAATTLHKGVIAQCDALDGKTDGIIGDPRMCRVDFKPIMCKPGEADKTCLTKKQADIAKQMYDGPRGSNGDILAPSSAYPGSELSWISFITPRWTVGYAKDMLRYSAFYPPKGPNWEPDPSEMAEYARQMGVAEGLSSALNPDLRRFKANGGKLLSYYGWADAFGGADAITDYYETTERVMGGKSQTQDFFRLFMMPGMNHCGGGNGAFVYDYLGALDTWVEESEAPDSLTGFHPDSEGKPEFFETVYPYQTSIKPVGPK